MLLIEAFLTLVTCQVFKDARILSFKHESKVWTIFIVPWKPWDERWRQSDFFEGGTKAGKSTHVIRRVLVMSNFSGFTIAQLWTIALLPQKYLAVWFKLLLDKREEWYKVDIVEILCNTTYDDDIVVLFVCRWLECISYICFAHTLLGFLASLDLANVNFVDVYQIERGLLVVHSQCFVEFDYNSSCSTTYI